MEPDFVSRFAHNGVVASEFSIELVFPEHPNALAAALDCLAPALQPIALRRLSLTLKKSTVTAELALQGDPVHPITILQALRDTLPPSASSCTVRGMQ